MEAILGYGVAEEINRRPLCVSLVKFLIGGVFQASQGLSQRCLCNAPGETRPNFNRAVAHPLVASQRHPSEIVIDPVSRQQSKDPLIVGGNPPDFLDQSENARMTNISRKTVEPLFRKLNHCFPALNLSGLTPTMCAASA